VPSPRQEHLPAVLCRESLSALGISVDRSDRRSRRWRARGAHRARTGRWPLRRPCVGRPCAWPCLLLVCRLDQTPQHSPLGNDRRPVTRSSCSEAGQRRSESRKRPNCGKRHTDTRDEISLQHLLSHDGLLTGVSGVCQGAGIRPDLSPSSSSPHVVRPSQGFRRSCGSQCPPARLDGAWPEAEGQVRTMSLRAASSASSRALLGVSAVAIT
jgi:hypothetical protein